MAAMHSISGGFAQFRHLCITSFALLIIASSGCNPSVAEPLAEKAIGAAIQVVVAKVVTAAIDEATAKPSDDPFTKFYWPTDSTNQGTVANRDAQPRPLSPKGEARRERICRRLLEVAANQTDSQ